MDLGETGFGDVTWIKNVKRYYGTAFRFHECREALDELRNYKRLKKEPYNKYITDNSLCSPVQFVVR